MARPGSVLSSASRFGLAGVINTIAGFAVIAALDLGRVVAAPIANAAGYIVGFGISYGLNRDFVFRNDEPIGMTGPRFAAAVLSAFALNQLALAISTHLLGNSEVARIASQLVAMTTYTGVLYVACRFWVFGRSDSRRS